MGSWKKVKFGDLFEQYRIEHIVQDNQDYGQITISKNGYIKFRATKNGKSIGRKRQFIIDLEKYPNTLLFTRQGVAEGAIAFAPKEVDRYIATENMPMFSLKDGVSRKFVELLLKSEQYISEVKKLIPTGSAQKSIHERDLMQILLCIPDEMEQKKLSGIIDNHLNNIEILNTEIETQQTLLKKLCQSILQEAIEGKLTASWREQNPDIESASVLLEKIKAEKELLIKEKKIKKQKPLPAISEDEIPFDIPDSWEWCRLGEICFKVTDGFHNSPKKIEEGFPYISATHVKSEKIDWKNCDHVNEKYHEELMRKAFPKKGEILLVNIGAGSATPAIIDVDYEFSFKNTAILKFNLELIYNLYIFNFFILKRPFLYTELTRGGLQPFLSLKVINSILLPLPPLEEQKEIVKKVESLFKIYDELETQINSSKVNSEMLVQAVLKEAFEEDQ